MVEITQEMIDRIHTDSDIEDLADELGVSYREMEYAILNEFEKETPCYNCKYVVGYSNICHFCSRRVSVKDYYEHIDIEREED